MEEFEYVGKWWLPEKPDKKVSGKLMFHPAEGFKLELVGLREEFQDFDKQLQPIILGVTLDDKIKSITLYNCSNDGAKTITRENCELLSLLFYTDVAFIGAHFQKPEDIKFKILYVDYLYLDEWVNISGFTINPQNLFNADEIVIKYKKPDPIQAVIGDYKIILEFKPIYPLSLPIARKEACIKQKTYIKIESSKDISLDECRKIINSVKDFLSFVIAESVYPLTVHGMGANQQVPVEVYYGRFIEIPKAIKKLFPDNILFTFADISDRFAEILKNWIEKVKILEPAYYLYFGTLYNTKMYLEHQFLNLIQALEAYHRQKYNGEYENYKPIYNEFKKIVDSSNIDRSFKDALEERLKYLNEYSLTKRLKELFKKYHIIHDFIIDKDNFIHKVVNTRNYLTHYSGKPQNIAAAEEELYNIIQKLKIILQICFLKDLGFNDEEIKNALNRYYNH